MESVSNTKQPQNNTEQKTRLNLAVKIKMLQFYRTLNRKVNSVVATMESLPKGINDRLMS